METFLRTPQEIFNQPQRLDVPLFQRPYIWSRDVQWEPLWGDVERQALRVIVADGAPITKHFLGAVVLQRMSAELGGVHKWSIIDGQQRLTTLQLLMDAVDAVLMEADAVAPASQLRDLTENGENYRRAPDDRFKLWPTNRDRNAFREVMTAPTPVNYPSLKHTGDRLVDAHALFSTLARNFVFADPRQVPIRAEALSNAIQQTLQIVVIQLEPDENAQEIFETLNARMTPLTAADLIKNFLFQRLLLESDADPGAAYSSYWQQFETAFWEQQVTQGRLKYPRVSLFFNHWLTFASGEDVVAAEVFRAFKRYVDAEPDQSTMETLRRIRSQADTYEAIVKIAEPDGDDGTRLSLFAYRAARLDTEVIKPVLLWVVDPEQEPIPTDQLDKGLVAIESWLVRRMLVRGTTRNYNRMFLELLNRLKNQPRERAGDEIESFLVSHKTEISYWPGDAVVREALLINTVYLTMVRRRLQMVLEAIEDHLRGFDNPGALTAEHRIPRLQTSIEHVMPQEWSQRWPLGEHAAADRNEIIHRLGNLTLVTQKLNTSLSNGAWAGSAGKRETIGSSSVLRVNRNVIDVEVWNEVVIERRTRDMVEVILAAWPVPSGHVGEVQAVAQPARRARVSDLIEAELLVPGQTLRGRTGGENTFATVMADGALDVSGTIWQTPSGAAKAVGKRVNGWWYWLVNDENQVSIADLYNEWQARVGESGESGALTIASDDSGTDSDETG